MSKIDLHLDLDGLILRRTGRPGFGGRREFEIAPGAMAFLSWASENFNCFWLTSRPRNGGYKDIDMAFRLAIPTNNLHAY